MGFNNNWKNRKDWRTKYSHKCTCPRCVDSRTKRVQNKLSKKELEQEKRNII